MIFLIMDSIHNSDLDAYTDLLTHIIFRPDHNICILKLLLRLFTVKQKLKQDHYR